MGFAFLDGIKVVKPSAGRCHESDNHYLDSAKGGPGDISEPEQVIPGIAETRKREDVSILPFFVVCGVEVVNLTPPLLAESVP